jgi:hypothetical protein
MNGNQCHLPKRVSNKGDVHVYDFVHSAIFGSAVGMENFVEKWFVPQLRLAACDCVDLCAIQRVLEIKRDIAKERTSSI